MTETSTKTATLVGLALGHYCPVTNFYKTSDDTYLLVTVNQLDAVGTLEEMGVDLTEAGIPTAHLRKSHIRSQPTYVLLADAETRVIDADGNHENGMTPLATYPPGTGFGEALAQLGYELINEEAVDVVDERTDDNEADPERVVY